MNYEFRSKPINKSVKMYYCYFFIIATIIVPSITHAVNLVDYNNENISGKNENEAIDHIVRINGEDNTVNITKSTLNNALMIFHKATSNVSDVTINCDTTCIGKNGQNAVNIQNGGSLKGEGLTIKSKSSNYNLYASGNSSIDLKNVTIEAEEGTALYIAGTSKVDIKEFKFTAKGGQGNSEANFISRGIYVGNGSTLNLKDGKITTESEGGYGIEFFDGAESSLNHVEIITKKNSAYGLYTSYGKVNARINRNSEISTEGDYSRGINISDGSFIELNNSEVTTKGKFAHGAVLSQSKILFNDKSKIITKGDDSTGIYAAYYSTSNLDSSAVQTLGKDSYGLRSLASTINLLESSVETYGDHAYGVKIDTYGYISLNKGSHISTHGSDAHAIYMNMNDDDEYKSTVILDNSSIKSEKGYGIAVFTVKSGTLNVNVSNKSSLEGKSGLITFKDASNSIQGTTLNLVVDGLSTVSGNIKQENSSKANITLKNASRWDFYDDSKITNMINDHSFIQFQNSGSGNFRTLTITGDYISHDGNIILNAKLNGDETQNDLMIVEGDTSGHTYVTIKNINGTGGKVINGIKFIEVKGKDAGTFEQKGRIVSGAYDYMLKQGEGDNSKNWYLTSEITPIEDEEEIPLPPNSGSIRTIRSEAGSYLANLISANTMFNLRLYDRQSERSYIDIATGEQKTTSMWIRNQYNHNIFKSVGDQYDVQNDSNVVLLGGDIVAWSTNEMDRLHLGLIGGYGHSTNNSHDKRNHHSSGHVEGYSIGIYGTWYENDNTKAGAYVDGWLMQNNLEGTVNGDELQTEKYDLNGFTGSLESGYNFLVTQSKHYNLWLQPQGQLTWMNVKADRHIEDNGSVITGSSNNLQTRLGLRATFESNKLKADTSGQVFFETNWLHNVESYYIQMDDTKVHQSGSKDLTEIKGGIEGFLNKNINVSSNLSYQLGSHNYRNLGLTLGIQMRF